MECNELIVEKLSKLCIDAERGADTWQIAVRSVVVVVYIGRSILRSLVRASECEICNFWILIDTPQADTMVHEASVVCLNQTFVHKRWRKRPMPLTRSCSSPRILRRNTAG